ncbi:UNVERIFIED_CONTAM: hypothetical protein FKN15_034056 [Acipenser sinensis]
MSESGHSQPGMYGPGRRRRRRRERDPGLPGQNLSGPGRERRSKPSQAGAASSSASVEKPIVLIKSREEGKPALPVDGAAQGPGIAAKGEKEGQRPTQPVYQIQNRGMASAAPGGSVDPVIGQSKLLPPEKMKHSIKLVDEQMNWCDSAMEYLLDQTDMLVVGVIGLQGTGKSTVMSLLSANTPEEDQRSYVFRTQSQEIKERGGNQSSGIDFFITQERIIFLDTQTAEMLKPSTPSTSHESSGSSGSDEGSEYYPHIVFLQNKSRRDDFCPRTLKKMHSVIDKLMMHSHLKYKGTLSMLDCNIFPGLPRDYLGSEVNLFLLPVMDSEGDEARAGSGAPLFSLLPGYRGHPSFTSLVSKLRSQVLSMSRCQLSHTILTEKNW